ncbi:hypothetical protein [Streptomyces vilmorinianum]|uniref:hypothetical protein n=1 Tax=Streptomyces vilmorinianum TaxID=3051092 RepID=UPI0010FAEF98|nr:hypothetical protein [Streptomyces vilmorinianum]
MKRRTGLGALLAGALALTGCGIQQTDVVEAGGPATIAVIPVQDSRFLLFYVDADGRLTPVARDMGGPFGGSEGYEPGSGTVLPTSPLGSGIIAPKALTVLLHGPNAAERAAGLHSRLPEPSAWKHAKEGPLLSQEPVRTAANGEHTLRISLNLPLGDLEGTAIRQLVCTAAYAEETDGRVSVVLSGPGGELPAQRCDDFIVGTPTTAAQDTPSEGTRNTPDTPDTPDTPNTPDTPETPDTPDRPSGTGGPSPTHAPPRTKPSPTRAAP